MAHTSGSVAWLGGCGTLAGTDDPTPTVDAPSEPPHRFRRTRIAATVFFGLLTVALCVLWVRTHYAVDSVYGPISGTTLLVVTSRQGGLGVGLSDVGTIPWDWIVMPADTAPRMNSASSLIPDAAFMGFELIWSSGKDYRVARSPYWFLISVAGAIAIRTWCGPMRFSLRTLLIATTLVAVVLGLGVWLSS